MNEKDLIRELIRILDSATQPLSSADLKSRLSVELAVSDLSDIIWHLLAQGIVEMTSDRRVVLSNKRAHMVR